MQATRGRRMEVVGCWTRWLTLTPVASKGETVFLIRAIVNKARPNVALQLRGDGVHSRDKAEYFAERVAMLELPI